MARAQRWRTVQPRRLTRTQTRTNNEGVAHVQSFSFSTRSGIHGDDDLVAEFVKMGARYVSIGTDRNFLLGACTQKAGQVGAIQS